MKFDALLYFLLINTTVLVLAWQKRKKEKIATSEGYFLGNRSLSFVLVGGMLFLTNVNAVQFIGENESVYLNNMSVMAWGMTSVLAMVIVAEFFMPIYLQGGFITTPDFLEACYDTTTKQLVSVVFLVSYLVNMLPSVLYGGAVVFNGVFGFSDVLGIPYWSVLWILIWIIGLAGLCYTIFGGLRVVAFSDALLGMGLFIVGICLPYFGFRHLGQGDFGAGLRLVLQSNTEHFNAIGGPSDAVPFSTLFTGMLLVNLNYWGMEQYIVQRTLASKNLAESQKGVALAALGKVFSPLMLNIPGIIAVHLYPKLHNTAEIFPRLAADVLPPVLVGLVAAVVFGAAITGFNAGLNSISTLLVMNIHKPIKAKQGITVSEADLIRKGKRVQVIAAIIGMGIAPFILFAKGGFYAYLQMVGGAFSVPVFTIIFMGFVTKRVPPFAAKTGLLGFVLVYLATQTVIDTGYHFLHILALLSVTTMAYMWAMGYFFPKKIPYASSPTQRIDIKPWPNRHYYFATLLLLMVLAYLLFSPIGIRWMKGW